MTIKPHLLAGLVVAMTGIASNALAVGSNVDEPNDGDPVIAQTIDGKDLVGVAIAHGDFSALTLAIKAAGLEETLRGKGPFTVFAPSNQAFAELPKEQFDALRKDREVLADLLRHHVVKGRFDAAALADETEIEALDGHQLKVTRQGGGIMIDGVPVIAADIPATNGMMHGMEAVLVPAEIEARLNSVMEAEESAALGN